MINRVAELRALRVLIFSHVLVFCRESARGVLKRTFLTFSFSPRNR